MSTQFVEEMINRKMNINVNEIVFTFYELRIKNNLTEEQVDEFLTLSKIRLENLGYQVYFKGAKFWYNGTQRIVKDNELMIAIIEYIWTTK